MQSAIYNLQCGAVMGNLVVFNGGLMRGQSAHWELKAATYVEAVYTAPCYRLYSIGDRYPAMLRDDDRGVSIAAELYYVPDAVWPYIDNIEPPGLYRGPVELADGRLLEGMRGLKLHSNLKQAPYLGLARTEPRYRIHSIGDVHPGMYRLEDGEQGGVGVPGELYRVSGELWPELEASEPPNLYRGRVLLDDGSEVWGILYPRELAEGRQPDITAYGGWREYIASREARS